MKTYLVTGAAGFIGCHFAKKISALGENLVVLDNLSYAGNLQNLEGIKHKFIKGDIRDQMLVIKILREEQIDFLVNFAAESHVDNSIKAPENFIQTNIVGTYNLLTCALSYWQERKHDFRFLHISTDEVFGSLNKADPKFNEETPYRPNSPYSASKAASDHLVRAWFETYGLPVITTNCSNNFGPNQHREKLIPTIIRNALDGKTIPIYGDGQNIRDWIFVGDHVDGIYTALHRGHVGETYCFGGDCEKTNLDLANEICTMLDELKPRADGKSYREQIKFVTDRLGHDKRYAISNAKVEHELGFKISKLFTERLRETIQWFLVNF
ncbi:MAG: dTDP-glucose 4,6-dehydratase [Alphaproteobacteria bacterium]|nr:dTDP-glucose 4,6-dehydratase [Alphaproteobacteria bacterium]